jgi:thiamine phosphate synthase YjbQ (UPF0047 family)
LTKSGLAEQDGAQQGSIGMAKPVPSAGPLRSFQDDLRVVANGGPQQDLTSAVADWLGTIQARDGLLTLQSRHDAANLTIVEQSTEAGAPTTAELAETATTSAPDNKSAALEDSGLAIPVFAGRLALGPGQFIRLSEERAAPPERRIALQFVGSTGAPPNKRARTG